MLESHQLPLFVSVVEVGLLPLNSTVSENETFPVCVELTAGSLERNITVSLLAGDGSALGESPCMMVNRLQFIFNNHHI